jgi:hypothetical protein
MSNFLGRRRRCPHGFEQRFFSDDDIPVSGFGGGRKIFFSEYFSEFIFYDGEDGLSGNSCRHFDLVSEGHSFDRMLFL